MYVDPTYLPTIAAGRWAINAWTDEPAQDGPDLGEDVTIEDCPYPEAAAEAARDVLIRYLSHPVPRHRATCQHVTHEAYPTPKGTPTWASIHRVFCREWADAAAAVRAGIDTSTEAQERRALALMAGILPTT